MMWRDWKRDREKMRLYICVFVEHVVTGNGVWTRIDKHTQYIERIICYVYTPNQEIYEENRKKKWKIYMIFDVIRKVEINCNKC